MKQAMGEIRRYTVILEQGEDGYVVAHCPALPGCVTQGRTREEALANAREALGLHLEGLIEHGGPIPDEDAEVLEVVI